MATIFLFAVLVSAWWAAVWLLLPIDLAALDLPALVTLHTAPPVLAVLALLTGKKAWAWNARKKEKARTDEQAAQEEAQRKAEASAREAELSRRRIFVECRGAWLAVPETPGWLTGGSAQCQAIEQDADALREIGREAALSSSLGAVLRAALAQCAALAYLPLYLLPGGGQDDLGLAREAWREALAEALSQDAPMPDCRLLPDSEAPLADQVLALFESDPTMPAMWLVGMDSRLEDGDDDAAGDGKPGHAVAALVLSRPNLTLDEADTVQQPDTPDPYTPYWEREQAHQDAPQWDKIPPGLRAQLMGLPPVAALHRSRALDIPGEGTRPMAIERLFREAVEAALVDAALREPDGKEQKGEPPDVGCLLHNCGTKNDPAGNHRVTPITSSLNGFDCWLKSDTVRNIYAEHGDTGAAAPALLLAEAAMCAASAQAPVMLATSQGGKKVCVGVVRPGA